MPQLYNEGLHWHCIFYKECLYTLTGKNPDVDTSFLPDRDREEEENKLR